MIPITKKLLLIGPYNPKIRIGQYLAPPLGVYRIASYLENKGLAEVDVVDPSLNRKELDKKLISKSYDIIGHSILHPTIKEDIKIIFDVNEKQPDALKIAGGQGASFNYTEIIKKTPVKIVIRGFGEKIFEKILNETNLSTIHSIHLKNGISNNQEVFTTKLSDGLTIDEFREISLGLNFEKIPYDTYWDLMKRYYSKDHLFMNMNEGMLKTVRLMTSNYCQMGCSFCSSTNFLNEGIRKKQKILQLSPDEIVELMNKALRFYPEIEAFYFNDDNFLFNKNRVLEFCDKVRKLDKTINLMCMGRVDNVDHDMLAKMKKAGFKIIFYGVETFSSRLAKEIKKTKKSYYENIARKSIFSTLDVGITPQISLILFLPTLSEKDLEITINNAIELIEKGAKVTIFPYPEAYSGAEMITIHDLNYHKFEIKGYKFSFPSYVLPDDINMRKLAEESLKIKKSLDETLKNRFNGRITQNIDSLHMFKAIYQNLGNPVDKIDELIEKTIQFR